MSRFGRVSLIAMALLAVASAASAAAGRTALEAEKGCWYTPPETPGCHECSGTCDATIGQVCCRIIIDE